MQELEVVREKIQNKYRVVKTDEDLGWNRAIDLCMNIINAQMKHMSDSWIPVEKYGLPKDEGVYDLTIIDGLGEYVSVRWQFLSGTYLSGTQHYVDGVHYWADNYQGNPINEFLSERVIAWRKKPEPYRPERSEQ